MRKLKYYLKIWWLLTRNAYTVVLGQKIALTFFLTGKTIKFTFFIGFLFFLVQGANGLAGYNSTQAIFFFLTFNLVDVLSQFFFREVYRFRPKVISGDFDLTLIKPSNALFMSLLSGADIIDFITIPPLVLATYYVGSLLNPTFFQVVIFLILILNALIIAAAFHISILALAIISLEIDHTIMIYRDLTSFGRFPVDIYNKPLQGALTYLIPIGAMMTIPAKSIMGLASAKGVMLCLLVGLAAILLSFRFWKLALKKYTSASS
jgi:ABC-2 type transport system permease protein